MYTHVGPHFEATEPSNTPVHTHADVMHAVSSCMLHPSPCPMRRLLSHCTTATPDPPDDVLRIRDQSD